MINTLFIKGRDLFLSDNPDGTNINQIKVHFQHLQSKESIENDIQQLNFLANAYIFREFSSQCDDSHPDYPVLQDLKSPSYRMLLIKRLPSNLNRLMRLEEMLIENDDIEKFLCLSPLIQEQAVNIANHPPFADENGWFHHFDDLKTKLDKEDFLAVISAAILKRHCLPERSSATELEFFNQGLSCGYINMQLAMEHNQSPIKCFLTSLIHFICRLYIFRELENRKKLPNKNKLLQELNHLSPKLSYWVAKDWGLCDDILYILKERFQKTTELSLPSYLMQKSEHANLALMLYQHGQFTRRQTQKFLAAMNIDYKPLFEHIASTTH